MHGGFEPPLNVEQHPRTVGVLSHRFSGGGTEVHLEIEFHLEGPGAWLVERLAGRVIARNVTATLLAARRILEFEERRPVSARRAHR